MGQLASIGANCAIILLLGLALGVTDKKNFHPGWLLVAIGLVFVNDAMLTNLFGLVPTAIPQSDWNWQGKLLAVALSLGVASLGWFGWKRSGLTLWQQPGSFKPVLVALALYAGFFLAIAFVFPGESADAETIAFQLTMPGVEEEIFYRGVLLLALNEAFRGRVQFLGIGWGWGAALSCIAFGLAHAFSLSIDSGVSFDPIYFMLTAVPSLLAVWLRERSGSVLFAIIAHNLGNSLPLFI